MDTEKLRAIKKQSVEQKAIWLSRYGDLRISHPHQIAGDSPQRWEVLLDYDSSNNSVFFLRHGYDLDGTLGEVLIAVLTYNEEQ